MEGIRYSGLFQRDQGELTVTLPRIMPEDFLHLLTMEMDENPEKHADRLFKEQPFLMDYLRTLHEKTQCSHHLPTGVLVLELIRHAREREEATTVKDALEQLKATSVKQQEFRNKELQSLFADPTMYKVATQLTDSLLVSLAYLCNYKHLIDGYDNKHDIGETIELLEGFVRDKFKELTGQEYLPEVCRFMEQK